LSSKLSDDFRSIVLNETPLLDVRAPIEFDKGAFLNATNIAILEDKERELIGTRYKEQGNSSAVALAEELIKQEGKQLRVKKWQAYLAKNPNAFLYCFRGGQRSGISQAWLEESGINITRLKGGYKAFRSFLMEESLRITQESKVIIIGGRTGSGKTLLLDEFDNTIDLEKLANHRGSTFGGFAKKQPTQINFENNLAYRLIQFEQMQYANLIIEHESHNIGKSFIPKPLYENLMRGQLVILQTPMKKRVEIIFEDYIVNSLEDYTLKYEDKAMNVWSDTINGSLDKMKKRLGGKLYAELKEIFSHAYEEHLNSNNTQGYKELIEKLLVEYYDPMYDYQLKQTKIPIIFRGNHAEIIKFLKV